MSEETLKTPRGARRLLLRPEVEATVAAPDHDRAHLNWKWFVATTAER